MNSTRRNTRTQHLSQGRLAIVHRGLALACLLMSPAFTSCSKDRPLPMQPIVDSTAPSDVRDLAVVAATDSTATLAWTAPGDDGDTGTASRYELYYQSRGLDWGTASTVQGVPRPEPPGTTQTMVVRGLPQGASLLFWIRTADEVPNWSRMSNIAGGKDVTPPAAVQGLEARNQSTSEIELVWRSVRDDVPSAPQPRYEIRYTTDPYGLLTEGGWQQAAVITGGWCAGELCGTRIGSLQANTTYYFAVRAMDDAGNWSSTSNVASETTRENPPVLMDTWWISGTNLDSGHISLDPFGNIYVAGHINDVTVKLDRHGVEVGRWDRSGDMAVDAVGNLYQISGVRPHFIEEFDPHGALLMQWGATGTGPGEFMGPVSLAIDPYGDIYVLDWNREGASRVLVFRPGATTGSSPQFVRQWPLTDIEAATLREPRSITVGGNYVYVVSRFTGGPRIQKFRRDGTLLWTRHATLGGMSSDAAGNVYIAGELGLVKLAPSGSIRGGFGGRFGDVAIDSSGAIYVASDAGVQKYGPAPNAAARSGARATQSGRSGRTGDH